MGTFCQTIRQENVSVYQFISIDNNRLMVVKCSISAVQVGELDWVIRVMIK